VVGRSGEKSAFSINQWVRLSFDFCADAMGNKQNHSPQKAQENTEWVTSEIPRAAGANAALRDDAFLSGGGHSGRHH